MDIKAVFDLVILKQLEEKCSRVEYAYTNGSSPSIEFNEQGDLKSLTYEDGTEIQFDDRGNISHFRNSDGVEMDYLFARAYDFFASQKDDIIDRYGQEGWDFLCEYTNIYATKMGIYMNSYLRGLISFDEFKSSVDNWWNHKTYDDFGYLWDNHDRFVEMLSTIDLPTGNFYSVRVMNHVHDNDSLDKAIVWDKAHTNSTAGAEMYRLGVFADTEFGWKVITDFSGSHNAKGLFLGNSLREKRGKDWEMEVNFAPNQKFERVLVDEEHKIIVQRPYEPS